MFLPASLLSVTISIFLIYNLVVPLQGSEEAFKKCQTPIESENALSEAMAKLESTHKDFFKLLSSNRTMANNWLNWRKLTIRDIRSEFLVMADGSHLRFPLNETDEQDKTISIAVSKLLMNLKTMQKTDYLIRLITFNLSSIKSEQFSRSYFGRSKIFQHPSEKEIEPPPPQPSKKMMRILLQDFFRMLDFQLKSDTELGDEYKKRLNEAREAVKEDPKMSGPLITVIKAWDEFSKTDQQMKLFEDKKTFRRSYLNDLFLRFSNERVVENVKRRDFARALIASSSSESKINDLYQQALIKAEEKLWNEGIWIYSMNPVKAEDTFFASLEEALEKDPVLYAKIRSLKKKMQTC